MQTNEIDNRQNLDIISSHDSAAGIVSITPPLLFGNQLLQRLLLRLGRGQIRHCVLKRSPLIGGDGHQAVLENIARVHPFVNGLDNNVDVSLWAATDSHGLVVKYLNLLRVVNS